MGFRFSRRLNILPGLSLNLSKSGASVSVGPRGAKLTLGPRGVRQTVGIPGTGLSYTTTRSWDSSSRPPILPPSTLPPPAEAIADRLTLGFFKSLVTSAEEKEWLAGVQAMVSGNEAAAASHFANSLHLADGALMAGILALKRKEPQTAADHLESARDRVNELGLHFHKYGLTGSFQVKITEEITAEMGPNERGVLLLLTEAYQRLHEIQKAIDTLNALYELDPADVVVRVSRAELLVDEIGTPEACQQVVELAKDVTPGSEVEAALLLFKAGALRKLGLLDAALDGASDLISSRKDWSERLRLAMRYERGIVLAALGETQKSRKDFGFIYAADPGYEDVGTRLGLK